MTRQQLEETFDRELPRFLDAWKQALRFPSVSAEPAGPRPGDRVSYDHVTLKSPRRGRLLVHRLTLDIVKGTRALVTSADELGRVALFRATAGIWDHGEGTITRPTIEHILFVPERPDLPPGAAGRPSAPARLIPAVRGP